MAVRNMTSTSLTPPVSLFDILPPPRGPQLPREGPHPKRRWENRDAPTTEDEEAVPLSDERDSLRRGAPRRVLKHVAKTALGALREMVDFIIVLTSKKENVHRPTTFQIHSSYSISNPDIKVKENV